jgi:hypothetical protein
VRRQSQAIEVEASVLARYPSSSLLSVVSRYNASMDRFVTSRRNSYPVVHFSLPAFDFVPFEKRHHPCPGVGKFL